MKYDFDENVDRRGTYSCKLEALPAGAPADALSVWVADMDFACAEPVLKALHDRIDKRIFGYTIYDNADLKKAVTGWFERRYNWKVAGEDVFFSPGVVPALAFLIHMLTEKGDGIIIQRPVYYPFTNKIIAGGRKLFNNSLVYENGDYRMDYEDLEQKFADEKVKGMILCSPHNPVGRVWTVDELRRLVDIAKKYNKWIISDEIHMDLTRKGVVHTPLSAVAPEYADHIIVCTAPSKTFNLAGMQISNIVITNKEWQRQWLEIIDEEYSVSMANPFGIAAAIAAYNEGEEWLDQLRDYLDANIQYVKDYVKEHLPKANVTAVEGTYLVWLDLNAYESDPKTLEKLMQNTARIAFDEGYIFGEEGNGFERINVAMPKAKLEDCMGRIKMALDTL